MPVERNRVLLSRARDMRANATSVERVLWRALRGQALGVRFRRQHPVPPYIADFACLDAKLIVEVDGGQHGGEDDRMRDAALARAGWRVLRYWNNDVLGKLDGVLQDILRAVAERRAGR